MKLFYDTRANLALKTVFPTSIPKDLAIIIARNFQIKRKKTLDATLGEIQQEVYLANNDSCQKRQIIKSYLQANAQFDRACQKPELQIKYRKGHNNCDYSTLKKHFKKIKFKSSRKKRYKFLHKSKFPKRKKKGNICFICRQKEHFAERCPKEAKKNEFTVT